MSFTFLSTSLTGATEPGFSGGYEWTLWAQEQLRLVSLLVTCCLKNEFDDIIMECFPVMFNNFFFFIETMQHLISTSVFSDGQCLTQDSVIQTNTVSFCKEE